MLSFLPLGCQVLQCIRYFTSQQNSEYRLQLIIYFRVEDHTLTVMMNSADRGLQCAHAYCQWKLLQWHKEWRLLN